MFVRISKTTSQGLQEPVINDDDIPIDFTVYYKFDVAADYNHQNHFIATISMHYPNENAFSTLPVMDITPNTLLSSPLAGNVFKPPLVGMSKVSTCVNAK